MLSPTVRADLAEIEVLLRGETVSIRDWVEQFNARRLAVQLLVIVLGAGLYGGVMGAWRDPQQAVYVAIKLPLILLLTTLGNALINAMLAPLLGVNLDIRQSLLAILMSFAIAAAILGSFSPLMLFLIWNAPPMSPEAGVSGTTYSLILLAHVGLIAFAGVAANLRLAQLLRVLSGSQRAARRVLIAWLAGNLFLGSQLSWILRPFIGSPALPVEFVRASAFRGNFYEAVLHSLLRLLGFS